ncbi:MAG: hypothetical protein KC413_04395, partial [Anaerolineales bacterium]|nr:hypothetical protein [Anaerolineales bacterium]
IKRDLLLPEYNILDLAPTIMHLLGEAVPRIMDGRVLQEIFVRETAVRYDETNTDGSQTDTHLSSEEAKQVEDRLRSLGYL